MSDITAARAVAEAYIAHAPRTSTEVARRLHRSSFDRAVIEKVVADLQQAGLLDDRALAEAWVESRSRSKGYGSVRLDAELRRKGVDSDIIGEAMRLIEPDREVDQARTVALQLIGGADIADYSVRRRLAGRLQRRGYSWPTIEQVLSDIASNR